MRNLKKFVVILSTAAMLFPAAGSLRAHDYNCEPCPDNSEQCYTDCRCAPSIGPVIAVGALVVGLIVGLVVTQDCSNHGHH